MFCFTIAVSWRGSQSRLIEGGQSAKTITETPASSKSETSQSSPQAAPRSSMSPVANPSAAAPANIDVPTNIPFAFDSSELDAASKKILDGVIGQISARTQPVVEIHGYSDSVGAPEYNRYLSEERARAVRDYLIRSGSLKGVLMKVVGHGSEGTVAPNANPDGSDDPEGRGKNRRVELIMYDSAVTSEHNP
jgi:OOP family OmpA-OmpF porin